MKDWLILMALFCAVPLRAQTPHWIWHGDTNATTAFFRKTFRTPPLTWNARLTVSADDNAEIYLNGVLVGRSTNWRQPARSEVSVRLNQGDNVIAVKAQNSSGAAGLLVHLNLNGQTNIVSDSSWLSLPGEEPNWSTLGYNAAHWSRATTLAKHGSPPWGDALFRASATPAENLTVPTGFEVSLLRSAEPGEGSWICMTFDHKGRIIISPQGDERPLLRVTLQGGQVAKVEPIPAPVRYAMGLLYAFDSLYANAHGPEGSGLYRLIDHNQSDQFETNELRLLKKFEGGSEHGYHALALGPDQKIYVLNGNGTKLPNGLSHHSPYRHYAEDALTGHRGESEGQDGTKAPNCHVLQTDADGREWKLWAGGMRNAYDLDFNEDGELFTFDSDMEWDWGTAWYRPTRILHLVSGGEYGWRDGTRLWPDYYPDALPPVADIGIGSPTGVKFATRSRFPEPYRSALYALDWSYGRIVAVHLTATNSSYQGRIEPFLQGTPLNLTGLAFGPDGAMYFITGGRGTQSGLYRVAATSAKAAPREPQNGTAIAARKIRKELEAFHGKSDPESLEFIFHQIYTANDPYIGFAARVALESQPLDTWKSRALLAKNGLPAPFLQLLALARTDPSQAPRIEIIERALKLHPANIWTARIIQIILARSGDVSPELEAALAKQLEPAYPNRDAQLNRELCRILLRVGAPGAIPKTMRLLEAALTQEEQMFYVEQLRNVRKGWTLEDRRALFTWFQKPRALAAHPPEILGFFKDVGREYVDGAYFNRYVRDFRRQAINTLTPEERAALQPLLASPVTEGQSVPARSRQFVQNWSMADLLPASEQQDYTPNLVRGRQAFVDAQCLACHRFGNDGGMAGPELTGAGSKYSPRDILEAIIEPSKVLSDQYQDHQVILQDGDTVTGRLMSESAEEVVLEIDRLAGSTQKITRKNVSQLRPSRISPMPEGLANILTKEEILDLIAYIRSGLAPQGANRTK